ncbi:MAG: grasp-with-spasm system SPASM domain peptide maturase [Phaeodactylibacter sp.]|nr:grasp-with-spasm system SPASM domain peptide maturase [Phaeodactylibacter sp.]MCB9275542.1 grasp-with-spasm system SPASM domain peptide maturase [Lewinellaceae bacterium]
MCVDKPFRLFSCCIPVRGAERSAICDLQRQKMHFIPDGLYEILTQHEGKTAGQVKAAYQHRFDETIDSYFHLLEKEEYIFYTETPERFPKMSLRWDEPALITNGIIDIGETILPWSEIILQLEALGCRYLHIRCYTGRPLSFFDALLQKFDGSSVESIILTIRFLSDYAEPLLLDLCTRFPRLSALQIHSMPTGHPFCLGPAPAGPLFFSEEQLNSSVHCGIISPAYFRINVKTFTEALNHNSCLNRKISIDVNGDIKNCPSLQESFGNIDNSTLQDAVGKEGFKKYWPITKDQVSVCKDCEFRYICTDCRAYLAGPDDLFSKPLKCGYDPYTCEWDDWADNPLKQRTAEYYGMQDILKQRGR